MLFLILLCLLQMMKNGRGFRTLRSYKAMRKKKRDPQAD